MIKYLIENNYDLSESKSRVLRWAARNGYLDIIKSIDANYPTYEYDVLMESIGTNRLEVAEYLIDKLRQLYSVCPLLLHFAARTGSLKMVKLLMKHPPGKDWLEELLNNITSTGQLEIIKYLKERLQDI